jgi:hypothetical protein
MSDSESRMVMSMAVMRGEDRGEPFLVASSIPFTVEELDAAGSKQFLQGPAACEPSASSQLLLDEHIRAGLEVLKIGNAALGLLVPLKHGVDGLAQLGAAGLVDAARIDPDMVHSLGQCELTYGLDLLESPLLGSHGQILHVLECDLVVAPRVREDPVGLVVPAGKTVGLEAVVRAIEEPHVGGDILRTVDE